MYKSTCQFVKIVLLFVLIGCHPASSFAGKENETPVYRSGLTQKLKALYTEWNVDTSSVTVTKWKEFRVERIKVPKGTPLVELSLDLWRLLDASEAKDIDVLERYRKNKKEIVFTFSDDKRNNRKIILSYGIGGYKFRLALVLEGAETVDPELIQKFLALPSYFGYVVPCYFLNQACSLINGQGEILVRLPMEKKTLQPKNDRASTIYLHSTASSIRKTLDLFRKPPCTVAGASHPFRSIVLTDTRVMKIILEQLRKRKKYFFEDQPMRNSVVYQLAKREKVPYLFCRDAIDGNDRQKAVRQIRRLMVIADKTGKAIARAKITRETLAAIKLLVPELHAHGIRFCVPSELLDL